MKNLFKLSLVVAMVFSASTLYAQKLGRINQQEVVQHMPEFAEMQKNLETYGKDLQDQLEQIQVEFNNKAQDFQKNAATMAESVRQMKQQELEQIQGRYQEFQRVAQEDYSKKSNELFEPIQKKLQEAIQKVAKAAAYTAVFDTSLPTLVYVDETTVTDMAPAVKKELGITEAAAPAAPAAAKK